MATSFLGEMLRRRNDTLVSPEDTKSVEWWFSRDGTIIKWTILGTLIAAFLLWLIGGSLHVRYRARKGLAPLPYHRCLAHRGRKDREADLERNSREARSDFTLHHEPICWRAPPPVYDPRQPPAYNDKTAFQSRVSETERREASLRDSMPI